jgi:16S rRNA (uracil1498-N3)-methyltransferase
LRPPVFNPLAPYDWRLAKLESREMKHRRFRIRPENIQGQRAFINDPQEIRHIRNVLRLGEGDPVSLFDGRGKEYLASIVQITRGRVVLSLKAEAASVPVESPAKIILGAALLKAPKFDWLLQKVTELGLSEIVPFSSSHVVPRWGGGQTGARGARWEKIVTEAAKQCGRAAIPRIHPLRSFEDALAYDAGRATKVLLWEKEKAVTLGETVAHSSRVFVLVGPEGGFSAEEALQAQAAGFQPVRLGPRILRAETAGVAIVALLQFILGDLNQ